MRSAPTELFELPRAAASVNVMATGLSYRKRARIAPVAEASGSDPMDHASMPTAAGVSSRPTAAWCHCLRPSCPCRWKATTARPWRGSLAKVLRCVASIQPRWRGMSRRTLPFFGSRAGGRPLSTRGALFSFGGGCDCTECGSLPAALDRLATGVGSLTHGSRADLQQPRHPTAVADTSLQCSVVSNEPPVAGGLPSFDSSSTSQEPTSGSGGGLHRAEVPAVPTVSTAKMANRRLCKELDEFEALAASAGTSGAAPAFSASLPRAHMRHAPRTVIKRCFDMPSPVWALTRPVSSDILHMGAHEAQPRLGRMLLLTRLHQASLRTKGHVLHPIHVLHPPDKSPDAI